jgi:hypothetical protein
MPAHVDPCDEVAGYHRVVYCAVLDKPLFDLFFNSKNGYRAWYYRSPAESIRANGVLRGSVAPALLACDFSDHVALDFVAKSLGAPSGKICVAEIGKGFCVKCQGDWKAPEDDTAEIFNGRWECSARPYSRYGRKAPFVEMIRIFGGFVSEQDREYVPKQKQRAGDGYSRLRLVLTTREVAPNLTRIAVGSGRCDHEPPRLKPAVYESESSACRILSTSSPSQPATCTCRC